ncbi:MAG: dephospho-CoA kinase [Clostridia bacterium]|nr:dephospho-CoA kinase [Clostridia bacterium]
MKYVIGLTGGIACGKSAVSDIFARNGIKIIDTDIISRLVMQEGQKCNEEVKQTFPDCVENGVINRRLLREIVFSNKQELAKLNAITLKYIKAETEAELRSQDGLAVLVVPLMFESGFDKMCDYIIDVACSEDVRINRLIKRDNITKELALSMINSQMNDDERRKKSDIVIENNGNIADLEKKVVNIINLLKERKI